MVILFVKLVVVITGIAVSGMILKRCLSLIRRKWSGNRRLKLVKPLIRQGVFEPETVLHAVGHSIPFKYQQVNPGLKRPAGRKVKVRVRDLFATMDFFLDNRVSCPNLLIFAHPGMGKTHFCINYFCHNQNRPKNVRHKILLVPLNRKNADSLIWECALKDRHVLILDGLDEDIKAFPDPRGRLLQLAELGRGFRRLIITCDLSVVQKNQNIREMKGYVIASPGDEHGSRPVKFRRYYLAPVRPRDMVRDLAGLFPSWGGKQKKEIIQFVQSGPLPGITPLTAGYLEDIWSDDIIGLNQKSGMYRAIVKRQLAHETAWKDKKLLMRFLCLFARDLYLERFERGEEAIGEKDLKAKAKAWHIECHPLRKGPPYLTGTTPEGNLKFSHRSFMAYFFVRQLLGGDTACYKNRLTHTMKTFFLEFAGGLWGEGLAAELQWLGQYGLKVAGVPERLPDGKRVSQTGLFRYLLPKTPRHRFLARLAPLFNNPVFYEFGWNPDLYKNLKRAVISSKTALMRLEKPRWTVMIHPGHLEINKKHQKPEKILINKANFLEYESLRGEAHLIRLNRTLGLNGLRMLNRINQSRHFCALPDLDNSQTFTLYFIEAPKRK